MAHSELHGEPYPGLLFSDAPRNVYWEMTISCDLACEHCRANAINHRDPLELSTEEAKKLFRDIHGMGSLLVLTGGDPLKRPDIFELIEYGRSLPIHIAVTPAVTPRLTRDVVARFASLSVNAMGLSIDGPNAEIHDGFRNVPGTFDRSMQALSWARELGVDVQVNTTITARTLPHIPALYELLCSTASPPVKRWSLFLLVPLGRGADLGVPSPQQIEELFGWVYDISEKAPFRVGTTEAPHYRRYWIERKLASGVPLAGIRARAKAMAFGIRDGNGVVFVSHRGEVYPAGFLPYPLLGNVREASLGDIYRDHAALRELRDPTYFHARCGRCEFKWACGGSRARAYTMTGDPLGEDPLCAYQPAESREHVASQHVEEAKPV